MEDTYDAIVLGTGLTESIVSGLLAVDGLKILNLDKNGYYGSESASLNLEQLYEKFKPSVKPNEALGKSRDYNIDVAPKFIISAGNLVKLLVHTQTTRYLDFKGIVGSYVFHDGKVHKVPATDSEALKSSLMGLFEKRRCQKFLAFVQDYEEDKPETHKKMDLKTMPMKALYKEYGLDSNTQDFVGHASALQLSDEYLDRPAIETIRRLKLYSDSLGRYGPSPYIYPLYGLGELPQAFSRLSAVFGTTYMLNAPFKGIKYDDTGKCCGVETADGTVIKTSMVVGDPTYFPDKVKKIGEVVKMVCILNHPVPNTADSESCQIIFPQNQVKRKYDIYVAVMSSANFVVPKGKWVAILSTTVETANPVAELDPALKLIGPVEESFSFVQPLFEPLTDGAADKVFISDSYDATSHFETTVDNVLDLYRRIRGKELRMKTHEEVEAEERQREAEENAKAQKDLEKEKEKEKE